MTSGPLVAALALWLLSASASAAMNTCTVTFDHGQELQVPVARTLEEQAAGLAHVPDPGPGMVFVWDTPAIRAFWMKDTPKPLTGVWIGEDGKIHSIQVMAPETDEAHFSVWPVIAVLEVPPGVLESHGITKLSRVASSSCFSVRDRPQAAG